MCNFRSYGYTLWTDLRIGSAAYMTRQTWSIGQTWLQLFTVQGTAGTCFGISICPGG